MKKWDGLPGSSRLVCAPQQSDAAVMSAFFREVVSCPSDGNEETLLVSPNCKSASTTESMQRMADYFGECCPWSKISVLEGAPHASFAFTSKKLQDAKAEKKETMGEQEVRITPLACPGSLHPVTNINLHLPRIHLYHQMAFG